MHLMPPLLVGPDVQAGTERYMPFLHREIAD